MKKILLIVVIILFTSCSKKVVETIPVMVVEQDISIPGAADIKYFSFPSSTIGYAASPSSFIYKTTDGGASWSQISVVATKTCYGLEFFDATNGMCLMNNDVYVTDDGGATWSIRGTGDFIGMTKSGIGVIGAFGNTTCVISTSVDQGQLFIIKGILTYDISFDFLSSRIVDNQVIIFSRNGYRYPNENVYNISNNNGSSIGFGNLTSAEVPIDAYLTGTSSLGTAVGSEGFLLDDLFGSLIDRTFYQHLYPYQSVDGNGNLVVAVGEKTITSNLDIGNDEKWNYVLDVDGNGFPNTFYKIRFVSSNTFYLSGSNGLILKASI